MQTQSAWYSTLIPLLFVFLWSTGFIGAKLGLPYADPLTFLFIRMWMAATLFYLAVSISKSNWTLTPREMFHASVVGILFHALYLGGVFVAISLGTDAGFSASCHYVKKTIRAGNHGCIAIDRQFPDRTDFVSMVSARHFRRHYLSEEILRSDRPFTIRMYPVRGSGIAAIADGNNH